MNQREAFLWVLEKAIFQPYLWGGNDPLAGFDCSGLVIEGLKSVGVLPRSGDWTADGLYRRFVRGNPIRAIPELKPGTLLFWDWENKGTKVHVEAVWTICDGVPLTIGASGGGSKTTSLAQAIAMDAYTKIRPAAEGWIGADPF